MINLNQRAKTMRIASISIDAKYNLPDKEKKHVLMKLLKSLIKYKAN